MIFFKYINPIFILLVVNFATALPSAKENGSKDNESAPLEVEAVAPSADAKNEDAKNDDAKKNDIEERAKRGEAQAQYEQALILKQNGEEDKALEWMIKSAKQNFVPAMDTLIIWYQRRGDVGQQTQWIMRAAKNNSIFAQALRALWHAKRGEIQQALKFMEIWKDSVRVKRAEMGGQNVRQTPDLREPMAQQETPSMEYQFAKIMEQRGDKNLALKWMQKAAEEPMYGRAILAQIALSKMFEQQGDISSAFKWLERAVQGHSYRPYVIFAEIELALLFKRQGKIGWAIHWMKEASNRHSIYDDSIDKFAVFAQNALATMYGRIDASVAEQYWQGIAKRYNKALPTHEDLEKEIESISSCQHVFSSM